MIIVDLHTSTGETLAQVLIPATEQMPQIILWGRQRFIWNPTAAQWWEAFEVEATDTLQA